MRLDVRMLDGSKSVVNQLLCLNSGLLRVAGAGAFDARDVIHWGIRSANASTRRLGVPLGLRKARPKRPGYTGRRDSSAGPDRSAGGGLFQLAARRLPRLIVAICRTEPPSIELRPC